MQAWSERNHGSHGGLQLRECGLAAGVSSSSTPRPELLGNEGEMKRRAAGLQKVHGTRDEAAARCARLLGLDGPHWPQAPRPGEVACQSAYNLGGCGPTICNPLRADGVAMRARDVIMSALQQSTTRVEAGREQDRARSRCTTLVGQARQTAGCGSAGRALSSLAPSGRCTQEPRERTTESGKTSRCRRPRCGG